MTAISDDFDGDVPYPFVAKVGGTGLEDRANGLGFGFGGSVLADPSAAASPQSGGTWLWGGVYGHSWFVDPERNITVIALTNTALEGMIGRFPIELRDAIYRAL